MSHYDRPDGAKQIDRQRGGDLEDRVRAELGFVLDHTNSSTLLDFWAPGFFVEVKGQYQPLGQRWLDHWPGCRVPFVLDELSVRKACEHFPHAYFVFGTHDDRLFVASIAEVVCSDRVRLDRRTEKWTKGKWLLDLAQFTEIDCALEDYELLPVLTQRHLLLQWKKSECIVDAPAV